MSKEYTTLKGATCEPKTRIDFSYSLRNEKESIWTIVFRTRTRGTCEILRSRRAQRQSRWIWRSAPLIGMHSGGRNPPTVVLMSVRGSHASLTKQFERGTTCSGSWHHHFVSSSSRSDLLISSVRRRSCHGNRPTAQPSPNGRRGSRQSPGGNHSPKHSWFYQTAVGTTSRLSINHSPARAPAAKVATPNAPNR